MRYNHFSSGIGVARVLEAGQLNGKDRLQDMAIDGYRIASKNEFMMNIWWDNHVITMG